MGKLGSILVMVALAQGCIHAPRNKPRAYATSAAAIVIGGSVAFAMHEKSCDGGSLGDDVGCSVGSNVVGVMGLALVGVGLATLGITALAPDAEDAKK